VAERDHHWLVRWHAWLRSAGIAEENIPRTMEEAEDFFPNLELPKDRDARLSLIDRRIRSYARRIRLGDRAAAAAAAATSYTGAAAASVIPAKVNAVVSKLTSTPPPPPAAPTAKLFDSGYPVTETWLQVPLPLSHLAECMGCNYRTAESRLARTGLRRVSPQGWICDLAPLPPKIRDRIEALVKGK
jgi:hypothetical protein